MHLPIRPLIFGLGQWFDRAVMSVVLGMVLLAIDFAERRSVAKET